MDLSAWLIRIAEEGLRDARSRIEPPPLPAPANPAAGAAEQRETILLAEAFGLPPPSREPIVHGELLL
jgi:hypothetical protein